MRWLLMIFACLLVASPALAAWPDSGTNETVATIGATGRNHSTIAAWEAATDVDITAGGSNISPVGDCYDDADLADFYITGATTDSTHYRRLTAHAGERHDGTDGDGVRCTHDSSYPHIMKDLYLVVEWLIFGPLGTVCVSMDGLANGHQILRNSVVHGPGAGIAGAAAATENIIRNCVVIGGSDKIGVSGSFTSQNCSVLGVAGAEIGFQGGTQTNCIAAIASGDWVYDAYYSSGGGDYNIGDDTSAPGENSIDNIAAADIYTNTGDGTEDLHLKSDATAASDAGDDLSGSFTIDIDGDTRGDGDSGADAGGGAPPAGAAPKARYNFRRPGQSAKRDCCA